MNAVHLTEQQEAAEEASRVQFQPLLAPNARSTNKTGRLIALGVIVAVSGYLWICYKSNQKIAAAMLNNKLQELKASDTKREASLALIRHDLGRSSSDYETLQNHQKVQADQMQLVLENLRATQKLVAVCEEQLKDLHESMAQAKDQIGRLETENKLLREQFLLDDKARAHQAELLDSLQQVSENQKTKSKTPERKRSFLGIHTR